MNLINVTVLTPTYNRVNNLNVLYESLCKQKDKNFSWLIIDDGSVDNTETVVSQWIKENLITITYKKKNNGGKHTALNYSYQFIDTPLTFIVDSDDYLTEDAISLINKTYDAFSHEKDLCGYSFLRGTVDGGFLSSSGVPTSGMKENFIDCRIKRNISGDMAEVWFTHCLKEFPFPEFENEKFLGEDIVWIRMAKKYKMRFFNDPIYISAYLPDGLTSNRRKHNISSPKGCVERAKTFISADIPLKQKVKAILQYQIYGRFAKITPLTLTHNPFIFILSVFLYIPSGLMYFVWKNRY